MCVQTMLLKHISAAIAVAFESQVVSLYCDYSRVGRDPLRAPVHSLIQASVVRHFSVSIEQVEAEVQQKVDKQGSSRISA
jgi:hypothetical protein